jgi:hypothetical protein
VKRLALAAGLLLAPLSGAAQTDPGFTQGQVPSATEWNGYFAAKVDVSGGSFTTYVLLKNYTVATLPTCTAALKYALAAVSDATAPTYNASLTGGGAIAVPVMCDGSAWKSH